MTIETFFTIWCGCGLLGYLIFKGKEIPSDYDNQKEVDRDIWAIGFMFAINVLGGIITLYLSFKEPDAPEKIRIRDNNRRKQEAEAIQREKQRQRSLYEKEIFDLEQEALRRIAWNKYHSMSGSINHVDEMTGKDFELFVASLYKHMGFQVEQISSGADQGVDIILLDNEGVRFAVQTKRWSKTVGNSAVQEVLGGKRYYRCKYAIVVTNSYFSRQAVELARRSGVRLIDRQQLTNLCYEHIPIRTPNYNETSWLSISHLAMKCLGKIDNQYLNTFINNNSELNRKRVLIDAKYKDII